MSVLGQTRSLEAIRSTSASPSQAEIYAPLRVVSVVPKWPQVAAGMSAAWSRAQQAPRQQRAVPP